jgi:hypothetical protein
MSDTPDLLIEFLLLQLQPFDGHTLHPAGIIGFWHHFKFLRKDMPYHKEAAVEIK